MSQFYFKILPLLIFTALLNVKCASDSKESLVQDVVVCDTVMVSYNQDVLPILKNNCLSCHSTGFEQGGIVLDDFDALQAYAESGLLMGVINHESGYSAMPKDLDQLSECNRAIIRIWIESGTPDN